MIENINDFSFENMRKKFPDKCPCYIENKPCHDMDPEELNCLLCYCPEYDQSKKEGGCKIDSKEGKWFFSDKLPSGKIWDCSSCNYPHKRENVEKYSKKAE
ncbi:MAG: cysteine-rich small domain-containing protein [Nitrososphaerales archaeon]|jgi:Zn-finger protein|nr:cysteine-rich small domain-containing protein [Nitrososphaerales archaeon]